MDSEDEAKQGAMDKKKKPRGDNDRKAATWSWLDLATWRRSNSSALNVLQLQSNERSPESRPGHQLPTSLQLSVTLDVWRGRSADGARAALIPCISRFVN